MRPVPPARARSSRKVRPELIDTLAAPGIPNDKIFAGKVRSRRACALRFHVVVAVYEMKRLGRAAVSVELPESSRFSISSAMSPPGLWPRPAVYL